MLCSYSDVAMAGNESKALIYGFLSKVWRRFIDDVFVVTLETLNSPCKLQMN